MSTNCARTACQKDLKEEVRVFLIWNDGSTSEPRSYCQKCGATIIRFNNRDDLNKLRYEVVCQGGE